MADGDDETARPPPAAAAMSSDGRKSSERVGPHSACRVGCRSEPALENEKSRLAARFVGQSRRPPPDTASASAARDLIDPEHA